MKKVRVLEDGKQFEAFVKIVLTSTDAQKGEKILHGISIAGSFTACRAIHAALYNLSSVELFDEATQTSETVKTTANYRRLESIDGKVCHIFAMPRSSITEDYQEAVVEKIKSKSDSLPERIILAPNGNIEETVGHFLAETYGLPKTSTWSKKYMQILGKENIEIIDVETTSLAGSWSNLKAVRVKSLRESDVLTKIEEAMQNGLLSTQNTSILGEGHFQEGMTTSEYLRKNASVLAKKIETYMKPLYDGNTISPYLGETKRICLPAQAKAVMGAIEVLKRKQGVFFVGAMGSGKTQMSLSTVYTYARNREDSGAKNGISVLIVAPSNVVPKWAKQEIPKVIKKGKYIIRMINNTEDALAYVQRVKNGYKVPKGKIEFVLVSTDRMKLAAQGFVLGARWDSQHYLWRSPNTGEPLIKPTIKKEDKEEDNIAGWSDVVQKPSNPPTTQEIDMARRKGLLAPNGLPIGYVKKWKSEIRAFQDDYKSKKNTSLARPARKQWGETKGNARWMIAQIFQKQLCNHFHLGIFDEIHQMKASDSGRGAAFAKIIKSVRKSIFLTGTLTNGSASSIQAILWRAFPGELLRDGINHQTSKEQWASRYGVLEKVVSRPEDDMTVGRNSNRKKETVIIKEKPGIAPQMITKYLLDKCIFMDLAELQVPLVQLEETPVVVSLDEEHLDEYKKLHRDLYNSALSFQKEMGSAAWSKFNPATINYADQPQLGCNIVFEKNVDNQRIILGEVKAPSFPENYETAKERALIKMVQDDLNKNRRCIVYTHYTGGYQTNERLKKVLEVNGIKSEIMNDKVSTSERFDWLETQAKNGTQVLIMNMKLVEVGLDLLEFPTLIFYQLNDDINVVRQASRRAWRLGQHRLCKVMFLVADETNEMVQFQRLMSRRVSAMIVEGRIERSDELAKYADLSTNGITQDLTKSLESSELTNAWKQAAAKDMNEDLELVSEEEFEARINEAFSQLTAKTIELSGYVAPAEEDTKNDEMDFDAFDIDMIEEAFAMFDELTADKVEEIFDLVDNLEKPTNNLVTVGKRREQRRRESLKSENMAQTVEQMSFDDLLAI